MARGFLRGVMVGTVVVSAGVGVLSVATDLPVGEAPETLAVAPDATEGATARPAALPALPAADSAPATPAANADATGEARATSVPDADSLSLTDTQAARKPDAAVPPTAALSAPQAGAGPVIRTAPDSPLVPPARLGAPVAPSGESDLTVSTAPPTPQPEALPDALPEEEREEIILTIPSLPEDEGVGRAGLPADDGAEAGEGARVSIGTPARTLGAGSSSRLPRLGDSEAEATGEATGEGTGAATGEGTAQGADGAQARVDISELPPVERYAAPYVASEGVPQMAIVLIDDGTSEIGVEALSTFPYPLSFALDTSWSGAAAAMEVYRKAGFEVLAMVSLPRGARASDVEVSLPVLLERLPEAVAIMETPDAALQGNREVIAQVNAYLADSGHGMLLFPKGLNTAQKVAAKDGVPSATVFRDFDSNGQTASTIKRFLNHAALKADAEGGVVMVGRLRPDTISALLLWGLQERGERLELAPVSVLLKTQ
ncbi:polysaccharide deacteylase family 2 protein [uncultured Lentibacter sp.]|uniref:polysaccharide deacteylase family 2 protein n=1 Tax=uncultured Lentibacter sp. TaxID=1659309 RepID=UPI002621EB28|nr:polysaccharide deacteylase family 2 protein [uncultured Lentibacter sp.]